MTHASEPHLQLVFVSMRAPDDQGSDDGLPPSTVEDSAAERRLFHAGQVFGASHRLDAIADRLRGFQPRADTDALDEVVLLVEAFLGRAYEIRERSRRVAMEYGLPARAWSSVCELSAQGGSAIASLPQEIGRPLDALVRCVRNDVSWRHTLVHDAMGLPMFRVDGGDPLDSEPVVHACQTQPKLAAQLRSAMTNVANDYANRADQLASRGRELAEAAVALAPVELQHR